MPNQRKNGYLGSPDFVEPHIYALSFKGKIAYIGKSTGGKRGYFTGGVIPNKIGKDKFIKGVIEYCEINQLNDREIYWIQKFSPRFNLASGGQGGLVGDVNPAKRPEVKEKISKALKNKPLSEEHKQKLREAKLRNPVRYWKNKPRPQETKNRVSEGVKRYHENKRSCETL